MDATRHPPAQMIIHKAMSGQPGQAEEGRTHDPHMEMPSLACAGMAGMEVAVVAHGQGLHGQALAQAGFDGGGVRGVRGAGWAHGCSGVSACFMCLPR